MPRSHLSTYSGSLVGSTLAKVRQPVPEAMARQPNSCALAKARADFESKSGQEAFRATDVAAFERECGYFMSASGKKELDDKKKQLRSKESVFEHLSDDERERDPGQKS